MNGTHQGLGSVSSLGGSIVVVMTRWSKRDLTGQVLKLQAPKEVVMSWEVIEFPALFENQTSHSVA
jgi:hypothetical protein